MRKNSLIGMSAILAVSALAFAGCSSNGAAASNDGGSSGKGGGTITYWSMYQETEPQAQVMKDAIAAYEKDTGGKVKVMWQGRSVLQKLQPALLTGDVPDIVDQDADSIYGTLVKPNQFTDLTGLLKQKVPGESITVGDAIKGYEDMDQADGKTFQIPYSVIANGILFNGTAMPDVAANPPKTWDQFMTILNAEKAKGVQPLVVDGDTNGNVGYWVSEMLQNELGGGGFLKIIEDKTGQAWNDPKVKDGIDKLAALSSDGLWLDGSFGSKYPTMQEQWAAGKGDFLNLASYSPSELSKSVSADFKFDAFPMPAVNAGDKPLTQANTIGFAIPKKAKNVKGAETFATYMLTKEAQTAQAKNGLVPRSDITVPDQYKDFQAMLKNDTLVKNADGMDRVAPTFMAEVFGPMSINLLSGKITADQFISQMQAKQKAYWDQNS